MLELVCLAKVETANVGSGQLFTGSGLSKLETVVLSSIGAWSYEKWSPTSPLSNIMKVINLICKLVRLAQARTRDVHWFTKTSL